jgi:hypothetical protein
MVDKNVFTTFNGDESVSLLVIEPLHCSLWHTACFLLLRSQNTPIQASHEDRQPHEDSFSTDVLEQKSTLPTKPAQVLSQMLRPVLLLHRTRGELLTSSPRLQGISAPKFNPLPNRDNTVPLPRRRDHSFGCVSGILCR